jgi:hypothetical protein
LSLLRDAASRLLLRTRAAGIKTAINGTSPVMTTEGNIRLDTQDEVAVEDDLV